MLMFLKALFSVGMLPNLRQIADQSAMRKATKRIMWRQLLKREPYTIITKNWMNYSSMWQMRRSL